MTSREMFSMNRRTALALGGAGLLASGLTSAPAQASVPVVTGNEFSPVTEFTVGTFKVYALLDGGFLAQTPQKIFGVDQSAEDFEQASRDHFIPADKFRGFYTPTLVNTGEQLVLFDTGRGEGAQPGSGNLLKALTAIGVEPQDIDVVVLTHMHGDHIGGLMRDDEPTFSNARYVTNAVEFEHWDGLGPDGGRGAQAFAQKVLPLKDKVTFIEPGGEVAPGITAMEAYGHTPGHTIFLLESNGQKLMLAADTANHYVWSLAYPDWEVIFDMDKKEAAKTRRRVFTMLAEERIPFIGYHMPFPALGFVEKQGDGFRYVPATYQLQFDEA
ncbi:putative quorum-quenching lactonase YtnP [Pseudovibrio axinellae]|uniref:Putative quorum-quenching lactonase YtnP n=1 Tax=Pseudovibrio axinellae TaxID=989403 RepID=A0A165X7J5_9HYPH|nr:MBL fold metallo-hydrolase [Pseudovibrio axinellae]KZL17428.1 putative quorum-quenching lactonase YtnP [Pseudovibrio axinellae]SER80473.1 Glyoxylase, beta-lactamase superfamily II [Pseudovibrio axinellae]